MRSKEGAVSVRLMPVITLFMVVLVVSGCSRAGKTKCNKPKEYHSSSSIEPLQLPADLDQPDRSGALVIPELSPNAKLRNSGDPCLETPPDYFESKAEIQ